MHSELWTGCRLLIDKPLTWTSFDVVNKVRYALKIPGRKIKVGHAGTLDPLASGLLIVCTGKFTKKINEIQDQDKEYTGTIRLGETRPSDDLETEVDQFFEFAHLSPEELHACATSFVGDYNHKPPVYSAVKVNGRRAYKLAREGIAAETKERTVSIHRFELNDFRLPEIDFLVQCSKGTYIRTLARDFGLRLKSGACLGGLRRTAIGDFQVADAWQLKELIAYINDNKSRYLENLSGAD